MTKCPQCGYERKKSDEIINATECPKCGIIYSKWTFVEKQEEKKILTQQPEQKKPEYKVSEGSGNIPRSLIYVGIVMVSAILAGTLVAPMLLKNYQFGKVQSNIAESPTTAGISQNEQTTAQNPMQEIKRPQYAPAASSAPRETLSIADIVRKNKQSVVVVKTATGMGSGFFINGDGHIVTNRHVLPNADKAEIKTISGNIFRITRIVTEDQEADLVIAATETPAGESVPIPLDAKLPEVGEKIVVIGNPLGLELTVSDGIVSALRTNQQAINFIQITAPVSSGNSGGPLLNMQGEVIGVATFQYRSGQNLNFCVAAARIQGLQTGANYSTDQNASGSFRTGSRRDVYCFADSNGKVSFVDWKTGMLISRSDGTLDRVKFERWVIEQIGGNPEQINPEKEARDDVDRNREQLFKSVFPHRSLSDTNLTSSERDWLERRYHRHYVEVYNRYMSRRNEAIRKYHYMMLEFERFSAGRS
jgi:hypothetical protein